MWVVPLEQLPLWGPSTDEDSRPKPVLARPATLRLLITVKAAPNPSARYGETVCVGALGMDPPWTGWIRLYPVHYRDLDDDGKFHKYDIIHVDALPASQDQRRESWKPIVDTMTTERHIASRQSRRNLLDPLVEDSMCWLNKQARDDRSARSIALIRVADISSLQVKRHPGWSAEDRKKIAGYLNQLDLLEPAKRSPLQAPRFTGAYRYRCADRHCRGHQQTLWDWEFVALQRRLDQLTDAEAAEQLRNKFLTQLCAADRDVAFYVGNQAARPQSFSIGGVYAPRRPAARYGSHLNR
ncbi:hypothetical protein JNW91_05915 [Micromonospora sp. STR1_7]|uniref:Uncharacterized protein n=1 Tax=Micromonospora parastrephiae TaxID=2806101 RepID=A0ABS1XQ97_9ACTN|nr:hypothetical protein [Micromonospora parastrephiae]MBM0231436.1 hypothetical protein [Micromonospora parastrephiae]